MSGAFDLDKKIVLGEFRPPHPPHMRAPPPDPDAFGLKLEPTGPRDVMVDDSESGLQNLVKSKNFV